MALGDSGLQLERSHRRLPNRPSVTLAGVVGATRSRSCRPHWHVRTQSVASSVRLVFPNRLPPAPLHGL